MWYGVRDSSAVGAVRPCDSRRMAAYERLDAWRLAHRLTLEIYRITRTFPPEEQFGVTVQVRRSAASVPANIAEGSGAVSPAEFRRFLTIASRSLNETRYWLHLAHDLNYLSDSDWHGCSRLTSRAGKVLWALISALK